MKTDTFLHPKLLIFESHPVQYHAPVYRTLQETFGVKVVVVYGSDCSISGHRDQEFGITFSWDTDLLSGYESIFLSRVKSAHPELIEKVSVRNMRNAVCNIDPTAILLLGYGSRFDHVAIRVALGKNKPLLFRGETTDHASQRGLARRIIREFALRFLYRKMSRLLYIGRRSRAHYLRLGCEPEKLIFSPYSVNASSFAWTEQDRSRLGKQTRYELNLSDSDFVILFSGKLSFRKGPDLLVSAIRELPPEKKERCIVLFLGSGAMHDDLELDAKRNPKVRIQFLGFKNQSELSKYYHTSNVLVLPSRYGETWGLVVNEALLHGLPCIVSSAVGCAPDLITERATGRVFEAGSVKSLCAAIAEQMQQTDSTLIREDCRKAVEPYSQDRAAEGIASAVREYL